jgi:hypothetical protein
MLARLNGIVQVKHRNTIILMLSAILIIGYDCFTLTTNGFLFRPYNYSDDALITLRYAENMAHGEGLVYNYGEKVLATTTPLYAIFIAIFIKIGFKAIPASICFNIMLSLISIYILFKLTKPSLLIPLIFIVPNILKWSMWGMEVSLVIFILSVIIYFVQEKKYILISIGCFLLVLTRIDNILFVMNLFVLTTAFSGKLGLNKRKICISGLYFALLSMAYVLLLYSYYNTLVPNSILAKMAWFEKPDYSYSEVIGFISKKHLIVFLVLGCTIIFKVIRDWPKESFLILLSFAQCLIQLLYFAVFLVPSHIFEWYQSSFWFFFSMFFITSSFYIFELAKKSIKNNLFEKLAAYVILPVLLLFNTQYFIITGIKGMFHEKTESFQKMHYMASQFLRQLSDVDVGNKNKTVLADNIGFIGYYSQMRVLDGVGLVSPEILKIKEAKKHFSILIMKFVPDYVVLCQNELLESKKAMLELGYKKIYDYDQMDPELKKQYSWLFAPYQIWARK